jgi:hypothetical protein
MRAFVELAEAPAIVRCDRPLFAYQRRRCRTWLRPGILFAALPDLAISLHGLRRLDARRRRPSG